VPVELAGGAENDVPGLEVGDRHKERHLAGHNLAPVDDAGLGESVMQVDICRAVAAAVDDQPETLVVPEAPDA
jgi:hypothetical protein